MLWGLFWLLFLVFVFYILLRLGAKYADKHDPGED